MKGLGGYAFIGGVLLALLMGFIPQVASMVYASLVLAILAIVVGVMNIEHKETTNMLLWIIATGVIGVASLSGAPMFGSFLSGFLTTLGQFFAWVSATFVVVAGYKILRK